MLTTTITSTLLCASISNIEIEPLVQSTRVGRVLHQLPGLKLIFLALMRIPQRHPIFKRCTNNPPRYAMYHYSCASHSCTCYVKHQLRNANVSTVHLVFLDFLRGHAYRSAFPFSDARIHPYECDIRAAKTRFIIFYQVYALWVILSAAVMYVFDS